jgi:hypothetical protein
MVIIILIVEVVGADSESQLLRIDAVELPHSLRLVALGRFYHEVIMICHLAKCMDDEVISVANKTHHFEPCAPIDLVMVDRHAAISTSDDVV